LGPASSVWRCGFAASDRHEEAIRLDPRYALAYAKLSLAANALGIN
jgi:tetratricopeptide (TPR) repeat protein